MLRDVHVSQKQKNNVFSYTFMVKLTVLPQPHAKFSLGVMALPHKIDALKNHDLSNVSQIPRGTRKGAVSAGYLFFDCCAVLLLYCIVLYCDVLSDIMICASAILFTII